MPVDAGGTAAVEASLIYNMADQNGVQQIHLTQLDGAGSAMTLTGDPAYHSWRPKWSPSGYAILMNRNRSTDANYDSTAAFIHTSLWVMDANGANPTQIVGSGQIGGALSLLTTPNWLSDGRIVFQVAGVIYIVDPDGTNQVTLTTNPSFTDWSDVCCSPDGTTLIGQRNNHNLWTIDLATGNTSALTTDGVSTAPAHFDPQFTPDGQWVMFETKNSTSGNFGLGQWQIEKMRPDGSERTIISPTTGVVANPQADRDGWVYIHYLTTSFQVARLRLDGTTVTPITLSTVGLRAGNPDVMNGRFTATTQIKPPATLSTQSIVSNSTTETSVLSRTIAANALHAGTCYRIRAFGHATTKATTPGNLTVRVRFGPTTLTGQVLASLVLAPAANVSAFSGLSAEAMFMCHLVGAASTASLDVQMEVRSAAVLSPVLIANTAQGPIATVVDTTIANLLEFTVQWQTADPTNTISITHCTIEPVIQP